MKKINLAITGCMGRMGQQLIKSAKSNKNFKIVTLTENKIVNKKILKKNTDSKGRKYEFRYQLIDVLDRNCIKIFR